MRWVRLAVFILIATLLQQGLVNLIAFSNSEIKPDLLLISLVFFAIYYNTTEAIIISFVIGFAADLIGGPMGTGIISFGIFGTLLAYLHRVVSLRSPPYQAIAIFIIGIASGTMIYLLGFLKGQPNIEKIWSFLLWSSLYSAVLGPFFFLPCAWWMRIKGKHFNRH
ncbi:rod shape-determining protein MreD [Planctomycetota bacterium]